MTNCDSFPLTEVLSFIVDNRGKSVPTVEDGIALIATNCIKNTELYPVFEKVRFLSKDTYDTWFRAHPKPGDIIFVNKGTPGRVCLVPDPVNFCIAQDMMAFRVNKNIIDNKFLFAVLRSPQFQNQIENFHVGTLIPHFKKGDLDKLIIPVPSMEVQKFIGETYYALCNKIELNNRMNKNLEEMAQAIFKSWFVDFEPFQDGEFEESELGMIPKGWRVGTLEEVCNIKYGKNLPTKKLQTQGYYVFGGNGIIGFYEEYLYSNPQVIISCRGAASGKVLTTLPYSFITNNSLVLELKQVLNYEFLKYYCLNNTFFFFSTGSAQPQITIENIKFVKILIPPLSIMDDFKRRIEVLDGHKYRNYLQNNNLEMIRDTLLPKLMSGEIRVPFEEVQ